MFNYLQYLRKAIIILLIVVITAVLLYATVHVVYTTAYQLLTIPFETFSDDMLVDLFGSFLIILIGIELLETIKVFLKDGEIHVELVILVAIIAIARKVIVWNFGVRTPVELISLSIMLGALSLSYFLIKKGGLNKTTSNDNHSVSTNESSSDTPKT